MWVQFTLIAPGGAEKSIKRSLFSRSTIGNKLPDASEGDRSPVSELALASRAFAVSTGLVPDLFLLDRTLEEIVRSKNTLEFIYKIKYLGDEFVDWPESSGSEPVSLLSLMSRLDSSPANSGKAVVFRHEPCLVYMEEVVADAGPALTGRVLVDILSNARRGVTKLNDRLVLEPEQVFRAGVWDTFAEAVDVEPEYSGAVVALNAADVFTSAQQKGDGLRVLRDGDTENLQALNIEGPTYKAIVGDLKAGFAVVVPSSLKESPDPVSTWWRVDPRTGECLGRILDGRGGVLKEYLITWATSFVVATTACLLVYAAVRGAIARQEKGEVEIKDAVKPRDFLRCAAFGVSVATFRANAAAPTHGLKLIGDKLVYVHYGIVTAETGALGIGVGFILVAMNTFLVPEDW